VPAAAICERSWNDATICVSARQIARYAWTTASIDVTVDDKVVLRTGGVLAATGRCTGEFEFRGSSHNAEIIWGIGWDPRFPSSYNLMASRLKNLGVPVKNWWFAYWPFLVALIALVVRRLMQ
jgi:hypothetical protein